MFDGDKSNVVSDDVIVRAAERNNVGIVPLYYEMGKAPAVKINSKKIYESLTFAYTKCNIGIISNMISKIWNKGNITSEDLKLIKILTAYNNFVIDGAKTLLVPKIPKRIQEQIDATSNSLLPNFFLYAKDKKDKQVCKHNESTVNRIKNIIKRRRLMFNEALVGTFDYKVLMNNRDVEINDELIDFWKTFTKTLNGYMFLDGDQRSNYQYLYDGVRDKMLEQYSDANYIADVLVAYYFGKVRSKRKVILWEVFGKEIFENIKRNTVGTACCRRCGARFKRKQDNQLICDKCKSEEPSEFKYIACSVCGFNMKVSKYSNTKMCQDCYVEYRKKYKANKAREYYNN